MGSVSELASGSEIDWEDNIAFFSYSLESGQMAELAFTRSPCK